MSAIAGRTARSAAGWCAQAGRLTGRLGAQVSLWGIVGLTFLLVLIAASRGNVVVVPNTTPRLFPSWIAGPFGGLLPGVPHRAVTLQLLVSAVIAAMFALYLHLIAYADRLDGRRLAIAVGVLAVVLFLGPPLLSSDPFTYLQTGRVGALHGLNPYTTTLVNGPHGGVLYRLVGWYRLRTLYGPAFILLTYVLGLLSAAVSLWALKLLTMLSALAILWLVRLAARELGRSPVVAVAFVAFNPVFIVWTWGGDHNDLLMTLLLLSAVQLSLVANRPGPADPRDRIWFPLVAGAAVGCAIAVKVTAILALPFIVLAGQRRWKLAGAAGSLVVWGVVTLVAFGPHLPDLAAGNRLVFPWSLPNLLGYAVGSGGETAGMRAFWEGVEIVAVIGLSVYTVRHRSAWLAATGVTFGVVIVTLSWVEPFYICWLLPFAALAGSRPLRLATIAICLLLLWQYLPVESTVFFRLHFEPQSSALGHAQNQYLLSLANPADSSAVASARAKPQRAVAVAPGQMHALVCFWPRADARTGAGAHRALAHAHRALAHARQPSERAAVGAGGARLRPQRRSDRRGSAQAAAPAAAGAASAPASAPATINGMIAPPRSASSSACRPALRSTR